MRIFKALLGAAEIVAGTTISVVGGSIEYVLHTIGTSCPDQSFSEWEESQKAYDSLSQEDMLLAKVGDKLASKGFDTFKAGMQKK